MRDGMSYVGPFDRADSLLLNVARPRPADSKLLGLELLRFLSALAVLVFHYSHFAQIAGMAPVERAAIPFYALLWPLYEFGQYGVQIFWGISGYIFFWKYGAAIHSGAVGAGRFFWLRFSRLYPLHIVTLASVVGLQALYRQLAGLDFIYPADDAGLFARQLLLATDWGPAPPMSFNGPIWSISAEVAVYAGFYLAIRRFAPSRELCATILIAGLGLQLAGLDWVSIGCATYFFAGGLAVLAPAKSEWKAAVLLAGLGLLGAVTGALADRDKLPMVLLVAVPCLMVLAARHWPALERAERTIQFAGNLTYSSYLLHFPLQLLLAIGVVATGVFPDLTSPGFFATYLGTTLGVAAFSYRCFELPAQQWLRRHTLDRATA